MLERLKFGTFEVVCDICGYSERFNTDGDFWELLKQMKKSGWKSMKVDNEWRHYCPQCKQSYYKPEEDI